MDFVVVNNIDTLSIYDLVYMVLMTHIDTIISYEYKKRYKIF